MKSHHSSELGGEVVVVSKDATEVRSSFHPSVASNILPEDRLLVLTDEVGKLYGRRLTSAERDFIWGQINALAGAAAERLNIDKFKLLVPDPVTNSREALKHNAEVRAFAKTIREFVDLPDKPSHEITYAVMRDLPDGSKTKSHTSVIKAQPQSAPTSEELQRMDNLEKTANLAVAGAKRIKSLEKEVRSLKADITQLQEAMVEILNALSKPSSKQSAASEAAKQIPPLVKINGGSSLADLRKSAGVDK